MNEKLLKFISNIVLNFFFEEKLNITFIEVKKTEYDEFIVKLKINGSPYLIFSKDYLGKDLSFVTNKLNQIGIKVNRFLPIKNTNDEYVFRYNNGKSTPYQYEHPDDDCYVVIKI